VCKSSRDFTNLLKSPVVNADIKKKIVDAVTAGKISALTRSFNTLLINKSRESNLPEITKAFIDQYKKFKNIHTVKLTTALPVSDAMRQAIKERVKQASGFTNIELDEHVDDSIIGGFVLQIGDKLIDGSIAYDLKNIARQFDNNDFIYKIR
jgi:F-type H+-transporting ATPase subunit delta